MRSSSLITFGRLTAVAGAALLILAAPTHVSACSGPPRTLADVITQSQLIVEGQVTAALVNGLTYDIAVQEAFKGEVPGPVVRIGPDEDPGGRGCEIGLEVGSHVIVGVTDTHAMLSALSTAVWYIAPDGSLSSPGNYYSMASDVDDLRTRLRNAIPDTALRAPSRSP